MTGSPVKERFINQRTERNKWVSLGVYKFTGAPIVRLNSVTQDGLGLDDIAWDAIAFQALTQKPKHVIAALGDSYTSGEERGQLFPRDRQQPRQAGMERVQAQQ